MNCGEPYETPCADVVSHVYFYLDGELGELDAAKVRQHLDECGPCLQEYGLEETVKRLVHKYGADGHVPTDLRAEVLRRLFG